MDINAFLDGLSAMGLTLRREGGSIRFKGPKGALGAAEKAFLRENHTTVLQRITERAGVQVQELPLTQGQRSLWFVYRQAPLSAAYNLALAARVRARINVAQLELAFQTVVDRHAALRASFPLRDGQPVQRIPDRREIRLAVHRAGGLSDQELMRRLRADYARPFNLEAGPVCRLGLYSRADDDHVTLLGLHHIAGDAASCEVITDELRRIYIELAGGPSAGLSAVTNDFPDFVLWQRQMLENPSTNRLLKHWSERLAPPLPTLSLPSDRPRPAIASFRGATLNSSLGPDLIAGIDAAATVARTTRFAVLIAALSALLGRLAGQDDVVIGTPFLGRTQERFARTVGLFANPLPIRLRVPVTRAFDELVKDAAVQVLEALDSQDMPLLRLVEALKPPRDPSRQPLFDVLFIFLPREQRQPLAMRDPFLPSEPIVLDQMEGQFDLVVAVDDAPDGIALHWRYSTDLFDQSTIQRFADGFEALLRVTLADPARAIGDAPLAEATVEALPGDAVAAFLDWLAAREVSLSIDGEQLRISAPKGAIDAALRDELVAMKPALIDALRAGAGVSTGTMRTALPLSFAQQRLWFLDRLEPGSVAFNIRTPAWCDEPLDGKLLWEALLLLTRRHDALRMRFREDDGAPFAEVVEDLAPEFQHLDLGHVAEEERQAVAEQIVQEQLRRPFDLAHGPLFRVTLVTLSPDRPMLQLCVHHIVADGWSLALMQRELVEIYDALAAGRTPALPPVLVQCTEHAQRERRMASSREWARQIDYWRGNLEGAPAVIELPTDRPRPPRQSFRGAHRMARIDSGLLAELGALARAEGATLYMVLLAAWMVLLHRYSGQEDIVVGSPLANRNDPAEDGMVGCVISNVVLRCRPDSGTSFRAFLGEVRQTTLAALEHGAVPFDLLVEALKPERSASHTPIFQVLFSLMSFAKTEKGFGGKAVEPMFLDTGAARHDLVLDLVEYGGELLARYEYATDLFDPATIERMHTHYETLLRSAAAQPEAALAGLGMVTEADRERIAAANAATERLRGDAGTAIDLVETAARAMPDRPAVTDAAETLSYSAFEARANRLAHLLREEGVRDRDLVAVCLERGADLPVALAAVWKAGAAYLPLDPTHPAERIADILSDAGVASILTTSSVAGRLGGDRNLLLLDRMGDQLSALPETPPVRTAGPEDLAYVIYTSGSTGRPKGVEVEHRNLVAFLDAMRAEPRLAAGETLLSVTTPSFDIAGLELWLPLTTGARVVIAERAETLDGRALAALLEREAVDMLQATPATWTLLLETGWSGRPGLRALCGGEALPRRLAADLVDRVGALWNMYGPTETTIWSTMQRVARSEDAQSIGRPIANTRTYILDSRGGPVPPGGIGELCIGGAGVARGYRGQADLTAERFVILDLPGREGERVYRTGDFARETADGRILFLGRRDFQVKLRGFRIELGEIEAALSSLEGVAEGVVGTHERAPGELDIVAYVVPAAGHEASPLHLREALRARLPEYMVPAHVVSLDALPLTPNLKVDRKALPPPEPSVASPAAAGAALEDGEALMNPVQRRVAEIWRSVLSIPRVGLDDNFFDVGGHSMLLVRLHERLRSELGAAMGLIELFQRTTVAQQAAAIGGAALIGSEVEAAGSPAAQRPQVSAGRLARARERAGRFVRG